jgi:glycerophosphoryl diester phosphodiesterase
VIPHHKLVDARLVQEVQRAGKKILMWTVNSRAEMEKFRDWGVDGIISDETSLLARTLRS